MGSRQQCVKLLGPVAALCAVVAVFRGFRNRKRAGPENEEVNESKQDCAGGRGKDGDVVPRKVWRVMGGAGSLERLRLVSETLSLPSCECSACSVLEGGIGVGTVQVRVKAIGLNFAVIQLDPGPVAAMQTCL